MERARRSNSQIGCAARPPQNSGVIIQDNSNVSNNRLIHAYIPNPQESFKRDANLYLPMSNVTKIMRSVLPENAKISDDAKETVQECVSEFIDHITREANAICHRDHRKIITPEDLLYAMEKTKFHNYAETMTQFLRRQREEDLARNFMRDRPLIWPNVVEYIRAQDQVLDQQVVDTGPQDGLIGPMNDDFYTPNLGEGSSSGPPMDAGVDFPLEEFDVYQPFK